jgi:hypothetical protein
MTGIVPSIISKINLEHTNWPGKPKILRNFIYLNHLWLKNTANWAQTKASPTKSHCQLEVGRANLCNPKELAKVIQQSQS